MQPKIDPVHISNLKKIAMSPAHYLAGLESNEDSPQMRFGRLVHALVLGGDYVVYEGDRRGKAWTTFELENAGREIVTKKEYDRASLVAGAVLMHPQAGPVLRGEKEKLVDWEKMGRACQSRLDVLNKNERFLTDLKTTPCANPDWMRRQAFKMAYHAQMAWYRQAATFIGSPIDNVFLLCVEVKRPYAVTVMRFTPRALELGDQLAHSWMELLLACERSDTWPEYAQQVVELDAYEDKLDLIFEDEKEDEEAA